MIFQMHSSLFIAKGLIFDLCLEIILRRPFFTKKVYSTFFI